MAHNQSAALAVVAAASDRTRAAAVALRGAPSRASTLRGAPSRASLVVLRGRGQLHVPPPLAHASVLVYELTFNFGVRRVLITLELVPTALLRTRTTTVRDLRACACVSVRVRAVPTSLPAAPCLWARCTCVSAPVPAAPVPRHSKSSSSSSHAGGCRRLRDVALGGGGGMRRLQR